MPNRALKLTKLKTLQLCVIIIALTELMMITMGTMTWCTVPGERGGEVKRAGYDNDNAIGDNVDK